jgi:hypothetical protein
MALAASGSVGETIAPRANATGQVIPSTMAMAATATAAAVARTSPTASSEIVRASARRSRGEAKKPAQYSSGGRKATRTSSGGRVTSGMPGTNPITSPPSTSRIG